MANFSVSLSTDAKDHLHFSGADQFGTPVPLPGPASVVSADPAIADFVPDADGLGGFVIAKAVGATTLTATVSGVSTAVSVTVVFPVFSTIIVSADTPVAQ